MAKVVVEGEVRIPVLFLTSMAPYNAGERAGFEENYAHKLVRAGYASYVDPDDAPPVVEISEEARAESEVVVRDHGEEARAREAAAKAEAAPAAEAQPGKAGNGRRNGRGRGRQEE